MRQRFSPLLAALLASCCLWAASPASLASEASPEAKLTELKSVIEQLKKELDSVKSNRQSLMSDLEASEKKISELNQKVETLKKQLENQQSNLNQLRSEREALASAKKQQEGQVEQHLSAAYRLGNQSAIKWVLNQENPAEMARHLKYFEYVIQARHRQIAQFQHTIGRLNELEPAIAAEHQSLLDNQRQLEAEKQALFESSQTRKRTLAALESAIDSKDQALKQQEQARKDLQAVMAKVTQVAAKLPALSEPEKPSPALKPAKVPSTESAKSGTSAQAQAASPVTDTTAPGATPRRGPFSAQKGLLPWPASGRVTNRYGSARVEGKVSWDGIYIEGALGAPVRAVHRGRVVFADYLRGHGLLIILDHGGGYLSLYAHNQSLNKSVGDAVESGQVIATLGNTGGQPTAGLYFELRYNGQPTDPKPWLRTSA
jgi:murein hydrolase activator